MTDIAWIITAPDGRRIEWCRDEPALIERLATWNHYARDGRYTGLAVPADNIVNEYPQDEIPESGGYNLIADMDDGDVLCEWCVRDPFNPIEDRRKDHHAGGYTGWGLVGWSTTGDTDSYTVCAHCNRVLVEDTETEE